MPMKQLLTLATAMAACTMPATLLAETLAPAETSHSNCLGATRGAHYDNTPAIEIDYRSGRLAVTLLDVEANCCFDQLVPLLERDANRLTFSYTDFGGLCYCMCLYNITGIYDGIEPGIYEIVFNDLYTSLTKTWTVEVAEGTSWRGMAGAPAPEPLVPSAMYATDCKHRYSAPGATRSATEDEYLHYTYRDGLFTVTDTNYWANCCPDSDFNVRLARDGQDVYMSVDYVDGMCDCICPYDVTGEYDQLEPGLYRLHYDPWFDDEHVWEIDLIEGADKSLYFRSASVAVPPASEPASIKADGAAVTVRGAGELQVAVVDAAGRTVMSASGSGTVTLDLAGCVPGWHVVRVKQGAQLTTRPVLR